MLFDCRFALSWRARLGETALIVEGLRSLYALRNRIDAVGLSGRGQIRETEMEGIASRDDLPERIIEKPFGTREGASENRR